MEEIDRQVLQLAYARAIGLRSAIPMSQPVAGLANDLNEIVSTIAPIIGDLARSFSMRPPDTWEGAGSGQIYCDAPVLKGRVSQLISILEQIYNINSQIMEIGSLYNSIHDAELKERCADLLSAPGHFDRVINQATQVLEDRIRSKAEIDRPLTGAALVNTALNTDPTKTILKVSESDEEHEGICHICRGLMLGFRNPTHHQIADRYSREDALKVCAFIDNLLSLINNAVVAKKR